MVCFLSWVVHTSHNCMFTDDYNVSGVLIGISVGIGSLGVSTVTTIIIVIIALKRKKKTLLVITIRVFLCTLKVTNSL